MELEFYIASGGTELIKRNEGRKEEEKKSVNNSSSSWSLN